MNKKLIISALLISYTGLAFGMSNTKGTSNLNTKIPTKLSLLKLKEAGAIVWNSEKNYWEVDIAKLQEVITLKSSETTPFEENKVFSDETSGPLAIGNW